MIIHKTILRGSEHAVFAEDFLFVHQTEQQVVAAVFDGCSGGIDSHFAATLMAKIFGKLVERQEIIISKNLMFQIFTELAHIQKQLNLKTDELLATIVLAVFEKKNKSAEIIVVGDGMFVVNGQTIKIDQDNKPIYPAYLLNKADSESIFDHWFNQFQYKYSFYEVNNIFLATDGIFSFRNIKNSLHIQQEIDDFVIDYLANDNFLLPNKSMLKRKCNLLNRKHFLHNLDDLAMIRLVE